MGFFGSKKLSAEDHERSITLARRLSRMNEADLLRESSKIEAAAKQRSQQGKRSLVSSNHIFFDTKFRVLSAAQISFGSLSIFTMYISCTCFNFLHSHVYFVLLLFDWRQHKITNGNQRVTTNRGAILRNELREKALQPW